MLIVWINSDIIDTGIKDSHYCTLWETDTTLVCQFQSYRPGVCLEGLWFYKQEFQVVDVDKVRLHRDIYLFF